MRQKAMHRLKKYQYLLARAYEYRMLQKSPGDRTLTNLFSEMQALVRPVTASSTPRPTSTLAAWLPLLAGQIADAYNTNVSQNTVPVEYELTPADRARLNAGEAVAIDFWEQGAWLARGGRAIVRQGLVEVAVTGGTGDFAYLDVAIEHNGEDGSAERQGLQLQALQ